MADHRDLDALLELAHDKSLEARASLVGAVSELYFDDGEALDGSEQSLVSDILRRLVHDVEASVRRALADRLARRPDAPRALVLELANDEIEVAYPILRHSRILDDGELMAIVRSRSHRHSAAIAGRRPVSEPLADVLVDTGNKEVIVTLLNNGGARISETTMSLLADEARRVEAYRAPLLRRDDLPAPLAARMYWWVSAALRQHILDRYDIDPEKLDLAIEDTVTAAVPNSRLRDAASPATLAALAKRMIDSRGRSPNLLVQALRSGRVPLFEALFAHMTGLSAAVIRRTVYQPGGEGLAVISRALGFAKSSFASIFLLSRQARPGDKAVDPAETSQVLALFDRLTEGAAKESLELWRRDPQYLMAIRSLSGRPGGRPH